MRRCENDELRKIAEADDLHVSVQAGRVDTRNANLNLVVRGRRRSLRSRLQRTRVQVVQAVNRQKGGRILVARLSKEVIFEWSKGRSWTQSTSLPCELAWQSISRTDDWCARPSRDYKDRAPARNCSALGNPVGPATSQEKT
jgi:hypothetical protein